MTEDDFEASAEQRDPLRRAPAQRRSRRRVDEILAAADDLIASEGLPALSIKSIAKRTGMPPVTVYQYFEDVEAVLLALTENDAERLNNRLVERVLSVTTVDTESIIRAAIGAFVESYAERPVFVDIAIRNVYLYPTIERHARSHNDEIADNLLAIFSEAGLATPELTHQEAKFAVDIADHIFQVAYFDSDEADEAIIEEGIRMLVAYIGRHTIR